MRIRKHSTVPISRFHHVDSDDGTAFLPDFRRGFVPSGDGDAEAFGEEFIAAATSANGMGEVARDELVTDDFGGLTVDVDADVELIGRKAS